MNRRSFDFRAGAFVGFTVSLSLLLALPSAAAAPSEKAIRNARELMRITGAADMGQRIANAMTSQFSAAIREAEPGIDARAFEIVNEVIQESYEAALGDDGPLATRIVALYTEHFTASELAELLQFYGTPVGKKVIATLPVIAEESMRLGQNWAAEVVPKAQGEIRRRFAKEGLLVEN